VTRDLTKLSPFDDDGALRVIVEAPRGSSLKLDYDPSLRIFTVSRDLSLGVVYPFDWGFVPGTRGEDGDPLDAMVLHPGSTYPGVLLPCRILGMVKLVQRDRDEKKTEINNRLIATPSWHTALKEFKEARDLPASWRAEFEELFLTVAKLSGKKLKLKGWASRRAAEKFVRANFA
jgi:inorganic pyrophosphatase